MGLLIDGKWHDQWYDTKSSGGAFVRQPTSFRDWVKRDGSTRFKAEAGRYHLYVSYACPWAHRTIIFRNLKKLEDVISMSSVGPYMLENGWEFTDEFPDHLNEKKYLRDIYTAAKPDYTGRVTLPILWDKTAKTIVNNESSDIIRMLNSEFDDYGDASLDFYSADLAPEIDRINEFVYDKVNNGVYKAGFATDHSVYEKAYEDLFSALDKLEVRLGKNRYLAGDRITEADWRLFTTLVRFDAVYHNHFKCNRQKIAEFENLSNYLRELYQMPGIAQTVRLDHIKAHYYGSHPMINPTGIVPKGPAVDFTSPHDRDRIGALQ
jgi:glutathionyl-hydroquinone reductase